MNRFLLNDCSPEQEIGLQDFFFTKHQVLFFPLSPKGEKKARKGKIHLKLALPFKTEESSLIQIVWKTPHRPQKALSSV